MEELTRLHWSKGVNECSCLNSQVAGNDRPLYPKVDQYWLKVAHSYAPLALQVVSNLHPWLEKDLGASTPESERFSACSLVSTLEV